MRKRKNILKVTIFIVVLLLMINVVSNILKKPLNDQWEASGLDNVWKNRQYYDVLLCGPSMSITNISSEELYIQKGITSITIGAPFQPMYLSYYALKDALLVQSPKAIIMDITSLFYEEDGLKELLDLDEHHYLHYTLDGMHSVKNKYDAFLVAKQLKPDLDKNNYFSSLYYNHSNWENISKSNFTGTNGNCVMNGNLMLYDISDIEGRTMSPYEIENNGECEDVSEFNYQYLNKIIKMCKQKNVTLILINAKVDFQWDWKKYNTVNKIAKENQIEYLDVNLFEDEAKINWSLDLADDRHTNVIGTKKITDYIGNYLCDVINVTGNKKVKKFEDNKEHYEQIINEMKCKQKLYEEVDESKLIMDINKLDKNENIVIVCIENILQQDEQSKILDKLKTLGLKKLDFIQENYIGIVTDNIIQEWLQYQNISYTSDDNSSIRVNVELNENNENYDAIINEKDTVSLKDGINIIVYNTDIGIVFEGNFNNMTTSHPSYTKPV